MNSDDSPHIGGYCLFRLYLLQHGFAAWPDLYGLGCSGEGSHGEGYVFASKEVDFIAPISVS